MRSARAHVRFTTNSGHWPVANTQVGFVPDVDSGFVDAKISVALCELGDPSSIVIGSSLIA